MEIIPVYKIKLKSKGDKPSPYPPGGGNPVSGWTSSEEVLVDTEWLYQREKDDPDYWGQDEWHVWALAKLKEEFIDKNIVPPAYVLFEEY